VTQSYVHIKLRIDIHSKHVGYVIIPGFSQSSHFPFRGRKEVSWPKRAID